MRALPTCPDFSAAGLLPRLVIDWDSSRPWRPGIRSCTALQQPYLLGPPAVSTLDPSMWGMGRRPCHHLVVREAANRLTLLQAAQHDQLSQPAAAFVPPFWRQDARGLRAMEARWLDRLSSLGGTGASDTEHTPRRRSATDAFGVDYSVAAPWMSLSPSSRPHWRVRRQEHEADPDPRPVPPPLEADDTTDWAAPRPGAHPPWAAVWSRVHHLGLDRQHRFVAWQILHAVLPCGASRFYSAAARETPADIEVLVRDSNCPHCLPTAVPETLTHMLSECPTAAAVWRWAARLFAALSGADPPSLTVGLLLADDQTDWQPPGALQTVWTQLRLATLTAIRDGSSRRRRGQPASAISMAASVAHSMRTAIHRDWQRVTADSPGQLTAGICCSSWLRGRQPFMPLDEFRRTWAHSDSWCTVQTVASRPTLTVHLGASRPVPFSDEEA